MPVHMWNFFRAVGTGADLKCWNEDNPQVLSVVVNVMRSFKMFLKRLRMVEKVATKSLKTV